MARREIRSEITGSLWKIVKNPGDDVVEEEAIMILESMKMEIPVLADSHGVIKEILVNEGEPVMEGQVVAILEV